MRDAFAAGAVAPQAADAQQGTGNADIQIVGPDAGEVDFHDPAVTHSIDIRGRVPEPA